MKGVLLVLVLLVLVLLLSLTNALIKILPVFDFFHIPFTRPSIDILTPLKYNSNNYNIHSIQCAANGEEVKSCALDFTRRKLFFGKTFMVIKTSNIKAES